MRDGGVEGEVEGLQRLGGGDAAAADPQVQLLVSAPFDLVLRQPREELEVGPLLANACWLRTSSVSRMPRGATA